MQIERRPLDQVTPPSWNVRTGHAVDGIAESITTHGMLDPIGVWAFQDGEPLEPPHLIVEGSGRFYAVKELGHEDIPTIPHDFPDEAAAQAYAINHNLQTDESEFDDARLEATLTGLEARERLHESGFDGSALVELRERLDQADQDEAIRRRELLTDPDEVPDEPDAPITERGDVWVCGDHRVMCGDATDADAVRGLVVERSAICFTSPPYNADSNALSGNTHMRASRYIGDEDALEAGSYRELLSEFVTVALERCRVAVVNIQLLAGNKRDVLEWLHGLSAHLVDIAIWDKTHAAPQQAQRVMNSQYELLVFLSPETPANRAIETADFRGTVPNVYTAPPQRSNEASAVHAATFPAHLPEWVLSTFDASRGAVFDPFLGSGTTMIAAEKLGRVCYGMEIEPRYVDVAVRRWMNATGQVATRESDGMEFPHE